MTMSKRDQEPSLVTLKHFFDTLVIRPPCQALEAHPQPLSPTPTRSDHTTLATA